MPIYLKDDSVREERFRSIRTVLSIHNIEYQAATAARPWGTCSAWTTLGG